MLERVLNSGSLSSRYLSGFSPPSPVLLLAPMRFILMAKVEWASMDKLPKLMAPENENKIEITR